MGCVSPPPPPPPSGLAATHSAASVTESEPGQETDRQGHRDTEEHILHECWAYSDLRNFESLKDAGDKRIVDFFRSVIERRAKQSGA